MSLYGCVISTAKVRGRGTIPCIFLLSFCFLLIESRLFTMFSGFFTTFVGKIAPLIPGF